LYQGAAFLLDSVRRKAIRSAFSRVFNTPGNFYSDRFKHVLGPEVTYTYRSKFEEFDQIPRFDYLDFFREDPGIAEMLTHYAPGPSGVWRTYDLVYRGGIKPPLGPCRRVY